MSRPGNPFVRALLISLVAVASATAAQDTNAQDTVAQDTNPAQDTDAAQEPDAAPAPAAEDASAWFTEMLERTAEPLSAIEVAAADGLFTASLPGRLLAPVEALDGVHLMTFDFGAGVDAPGECYVYHHDLDLAGSLVQLSDAAFVQIEASQGALESKAIYAVDAGGIGAVPYAGLTWIYRAAGRGDSGQVAGQVRHWVAIKRGRALYCQTAAVGYDAAFFNVFTTFVASLDDRQPLEADGFYDALSLIELDGEVVGVQQTSMAVDEDGDIATRTRRAILLATAEQTVQASDSVSAQFAEPGGQLIAKAEIRGENGRRTTQLAFNRRAEDGVWQVLGTIDGAEVRHDLGEGDLLADLGQRLALQRWLQADGSSVERGAERSFRDWQPAADAARLVEVRWIYSGPHELGSAWARHTGEVGETRVTDAAMMPLLVIQRVGDRQMRTRRVYVRGEPWLAAADVGIAAAAGE